MLPSRKGELILIRLQQGRPPSSAVARVVNRSVDSCLLAV